MACRVDEWGFVYQPVRPPLWHLSWRLSDDRWRGITCQPSELAQLSACPIPASQGRFDVAGEHAARYGQTHALLGVIECTVFEMAWNLVGLEPFLADMALGKDYVGAAARLGWPTIASAWAWP